MFSKLPGNKWVFPRQSLDSKAKKVEPSRPRSFSHSGLLDTMMMEREERVV